MSFTGGRKYYIASDIREDRGALGRRGVYNLQFGLFHSGGNENRLSSDALRPPMGKGGLVTEVHWGLFERGRIKRRSLYLLILGDGFSSAI